MTTLIWKQINDLECEVSNTGLIRNTKTKRIFTQTMCLRTATHPYYKVSAKGKSGRNTRLIVHREIAKAFIPNPENKPYVDHINGDTLDNSICNLRWASAQENIFNAKCYKNNILNVKGVQKRENGKYRSRIRHNNKLINIGTFETIEEARKGYEEMAKKLFGDYCCISRY